MSLFLNAAEGDTSAPGWMRTATFKLWIINQRDPSRSVQKGVHPQFSESLVSATRRDHSKGCHAVKVLSDKSDLLRSVQDGAELKVSDIKLAQFSAQRTEGCGGRLSVCSL